MTRIHFVCQSGTFEANAVLLAASLRIHFPHEIGLIAAGRAWRARFGSRPSGHNPLMAWLHAARRAADFLPNVRDALTASSYTF
jgi:hypothetical protein